MKLQDIIKKIEANKLERERLSKARPLTCDVNTRLGELIAEHNELVRQYKIQAIVQYLEENKAKKITKKAFVTEVGKLSYIEKSNSYQIVRLREGGRKSYLSFEKGDSFYESEKAFYMTNHHGVFVEYPKKEG